MADIDVDYGPITITSNPVTVEVKGLDDIKLSIPETVKTDSKFTVSTPDTLKGDGKVTLSIPEPITNNVTFNASVDIKPVAFDQCLRLSLGALPPTHMCFPNRQHVGLSLFGVEIFGVTLSGEAHVIVGEPQRQTTIVSAAPKVAGDGVRIRLDR
jgi:hypothetical protein